MKSLKDLVETKKSSSFSFTSSDVVKYVDSPLIKDLKLSSKEFRQNFMIIKQMVDEYEKCNKLDDRCCNESNYHIKLIRDQNNNLQIISVPCEKLERILQVKSKYLIRNFSNKYLKVLLNPQSIGKLVSPTKAKLLDIYQKYLNENELKHGLYVYGTMGTGKTFTSIALANELALKNKTIAFIFVPDFTYELKQGISKGDSTNANYIDKMREADVLFLDDLGAESTNEWFYNEPLMIVLNYRMQNNKLTFINSNISMEQLSRKYASILKRTGNSFNAERLMERIKALTNNTEFELKGKDMRY